MSCGAQLVAELISILYFSMMTYKASKLLQTALVFLCDQIIRVHQWMGTCRIT